jgi:2-hydroxychromene-2-carboxylate isomerase
VRQDKNVAEPPVFLYDFNSPYAYLAAERVDEVLPGAEWRPISLGFLFRAIGKVPWSMRPGREEGMAEVEGRAAERGLPPVVWSDGWPVETYTLTPLRAALAAERLGALREFSLAAYRRFFAEGRSLDGEEAATDVARAAGVDPAEVVAGMQTAEVKDRLREHTDDAVARGVIGVPTVVIGERLFWGDDQLEAAAEAAGAPS